MGAWVMEEKKGANERRNGGIKARVEAVKGRYGDEGARSRLWWWWWWHERVWQWGELEVR